MMITLKDGVVKEFDNAVSVLEIAKSISEGLARMPAPVSLTAK